MKKIMNQSNKKIMNQNKKKIMNQSKKKIMNQNKKKKKNKFMYIKSHRLNIKNTSTKLISKLINKDKI